MAAAFNPVETSHPDFLTRMAGARGSAQTVTRFAVDGDAAGVADATANGATMAQAIRGAAGLTRAAVADRRDPAKLTLRTGDERTA